MNDNNLSVYTAQKWINKGVINEIINTKSEKSLNLLGWEIKTINNKEVD